jgi:hypothetical protein
MVYLEYGESMSRSNKIFVAIGKSIGLAVVGLAMVAGCDDATQRSSVPTTQPAVTSATAQPAADQSAVVAAYPSRPPAVLTIDGRQVAFPAARLAVVSHSGGLTLRLCSDDPPDAIDPGYAGNSFILDMRLPIDRTADIPACTWDHKPSDADDSISGIFIHGYRDGLRPYDVHVSFQKVDDQMLAYIDGTFLRDSANLAAPPDRVHVSTCVHVNSVE